MWRGMFSERGVVSCYVPRGGGEAFVEKAKGYKVDAYEVYRANAKNGKYVKLYTTKNAKKRSFTNGRNLQAGKTYYYKVRGVRTVDGKKYYTKWSNISAKKTR